MGLLGGDLKGVNYEIEEQVCVGVVVASKDYPYKNSKKEKIKILTKDSQDSLISYAGVSKEGEDLLASGREEFWCVWVRGNNVKEAVQNAYLMVELCSI